jgi:hypothetical protein
MQARVNRLQEQVRHIQRCILLLFIQQSTNIPDLRRYILESNAPNPIQESLACYIHGCRSKMSPDLRPALHQRHDGAPRRLGAAPPSGMTLSSRERARRSLKSGRRERAFGSQGRRRGGSGRPGFLTCSRGAQQVFRRHNEGDPGRKKPCSFGSALVGTNFSGTRHDDRQPIAVYDRLEDGSEHISWTTETPYPLQCHSRCDRRSKFTFTRAPPPSDVHDRHALPSCPPGLQPSRPPSIPPSCPPGVPTFRECKRGFDFDT